ncbi:hypothetical protein BSKO_10073 [Bryopsis sp. KO-2023]|nr:hypothetical protein BSKO_10073 [Bryopsis sp. KO-2023]
MSAILSAGRAHVAFSSKSVQRTGFRAVSNGSRVTMSASRPLWLPGSTPPAHLDGSMTGDFGWDPLGLGANPEAMTWFREAELQNGRWAMMGVFGILVQELVKPDIFWYDAPTKIDLPFNIIGIVAFQAFAMHYVEVRRWQDLRKPGSVNKDPIFSNYSLPEHEPGYPGGIFAPFVPGDLEELKLKELKNARLSMLAFVGFVMQAQITGKGPIACWTDHLADPFGTTIFSKAVITLGGAVKPTCQIPDHVTFQGIDIPTPCFFEGFWP